MNVAWLKGLWWGRRWTAAKGARIFRVLPSVVARRILFDAPIWRAPSSAAEPSVVKCCLPTSHRQPFRRIPTSHRQPFRRIPIHRRPHQGDLGATRCWPRACRRRWCSTSTGAFGLPTCTCSGAVALPLRCAKTVTSTTETAREYASSAQCAMSSTSSGRTNGGMVRSPRSRPAPMSPSGRRSACASSRWAPSAAACASRT